MARVVPNPVALDTSLWDEPITGIGLYTHQLYRALVATDLPVERWGARISGEVPRGRRSRTIWTLSQLPQLLVRRRPRLFHAVANFNLPLERLDSVPYVLTFHDAVPLLLPHTVSRAFRLQFRVWLARAVRVATRIICVSQVAKDSLLTLVEVDPARVHVIHHGVDHVERVGEPDATTVAWLDALGLPDPFILYAGALDARKNVELLLRAAQRLHRGGTSPTLVLAGQRWFGSQPIEREVARLRSAGVDIRTLGYLPDPAFYALMKRAGVFVFPSRYEGFGLPPLEAMRLKVPTIVSNAGALPEICAEGALTVDVDDAESLAERLNHLLHDSSARETLALRGFNRAARFAWSTCALQTSTVYGFC
jgi:glycosyltransferase involved in cell wall biosynthesis